ncbi:MAG: hypothetical protein M0R33_17975 [Methylomonas sp.]|jgi:hypothetical protein|uniref:hypothetical protein n=1 Tax=Methylomonas sp. TaxID=418 RepID=UPI0025FFC9AB|nr:hypothetical protein [Methylomonas sp.]MCK9608337.1 hypothetical protein [Methylomonas sp.]
MKYKNPFNLLPIKALLIIGSVGLGSAQASVSLPGGDIFLNGAFDELSYGSTGLAYITPFLYTGELTVTESPTTTATTTDLTYSYALNNLGSSMATITYRIGNTGSDAFTDLRFILDAQVDGSGSFSDVGETVPAPWGAALAGDPDQFQIADFNDDLPNTIGANNGLNGSDTCGGTCDVDFALQWNLAQINPGDIWTIIVGLSDNGQSLSSRSLRATSTDTANTALTLSGHANVSQVPLPPTFVLYLLGLGAMSFSKLRTGRL